MAIGEFARLSGLSARRLRSYAGSGLLSPSAVDSETGYRFYLPGQAREARLIDLLRTVGVPIADIASFLRDRPVGRLDEWAERLAVEMARRTEALEAARDLLEPALHPHRATNFEEDIVVITMRAHGATRQGDARDVNEDAFLASETCVAVADGMGGAPGGERAAESLVQVLEGLRSPATVETVEAAFTVANDRVWEDARSDAGLAGMGTTACAAVITNDGVAVANVGDSRCYLLRDGELSLVTTDHTIVADLLARGEITSQEASAHPHRHVLTRAVGVTPTVDADVVVVRPSHGDRLLLCTDGLAVLTDERLRELLGAGEPADAAESLLTEAGTSGLDDDVAVVVADVLLR
jgi:serine/threonine protein phosphatase PrpC